MTLDKNKARLVAKQYAEKEHINYEETFGPTAKMNTVRLVMAFAAQFKHKIDQMDVKTSF